MNSGRVAKRLLALVLVLGTVATLGLYYNGSPLSRLDERPRASVDWPPPPQAQRAESFEPSDGTNAHGAARLKSRFGQLQQLLSASVNRDTCPELGYAETNIDTVTQFSKFEFQPFWMKSREFWDDGFEQRYKQVLKETASGSSFPLKVIVVPHSHNDPGWLKTYEGYYHSQTRNILNNMVDKLAMFKNMTFIWSEISFLSQWWESAHPSKKKVIQRLIAEGRLEITTGGWVMTDEATSHIYGMLDQMIEGHQWVKNNLGVKVKTGWSVDPFGHGPTVPYLLKESEVTGGTIIQRIHYVWKEWLARNQNGHFFWRQNWDRSGHTDTLVHNLPFDIYSIKHSCGPHPQVCLNFDFRKIPGEYTEYSLRAVPIDEQNKKQKADLLMEQYGRTGSVSPFNVALIPLGDDFRYEQEMEWDQQYRNYKRLFDFINANKERYHNAEVKFGTPSDFFKVLRERSGDHFSTLRGDFFVYSDIFSEGRPAYWSGYYTSRPYWKVLDRELEANLRSSEILFTLAVNDARRKRLNDTVRLLERDYEKLTKARQNLALFQHHDAITGTSKAFVMNDYALKLFEGIQDCSFVQSFSVQSLLVKDEASVSPSAKIIIPDSDRQSYDKPPYRLALNLDKNKPRSVVVFNSHGRRRYELIKILLSEPYVRVVDSENVALKHQINPIWNVTKTDEPLSISKVCYELLFFATLEPLSLTTFTVHRSLNAEGLSSIYCKNCAGHSAFIVKPMRLGDIQLENAHVQALFDGKTGLLRKIVDKDTGTSQYIDIDFAAYQSAQFHSGAYLFMPDPNLRDTERKVLDDYPGPPTIIITSGPLSSEITVVYSILTHTVRLYHVKGIESRGLNVENVVDFDLPPKNRETELFMRLSTGISNGEPPVIYTDSNGFQMQKRITVKRIGVEGNYYPATSATYIEDNRHRLTVLLNHAQGVSGWEPGRIELMLDRRTLYDDSRGLGEGVVDNKRTLTKYWLLLETLSEDGNVYKNHVTNPSLTANLLSESLLYPANVFVVEPEAKHMLRPKTLALNKPLPCDVHLMNLRTMSDPIFQQFPSQSALMIIHRKGYDCRMNRGVRFSDCSLRQDKGAFDENTLFTEHTIKLSRTSLTGIHELGTIDQLDQVEVASMELIAINITFIV
ncbi:alpha-mannosidase 2 isoform X2 [Daktulosphaira vitifoliae]|uniref:alpha-mannosidase 2 isoform X1 n=1 Tax=Daktulosphaira vitifoliae TaxID=58002 RepID=UPI0021A9BDA3|nr:alpha-mannosidase 2 isoform X1 [Daktulosphaira vitifoliae]XP_050523264.1 alpha-mannosidase 2 isoform X2 [Daktulosphaira vitifoliae]